MRSLVRGMVACGVSVAVLTAALAQPAPAPAPTGEAASIELVVEGGVDSVQDNQHAKYRPGQPLQLRAIVKDAQGNVVRGDDCAPEIGVADNTTPEGQPRSQLLGNNLVFGPGLGKFSVFAYCKNKPSITSEIEGNFESSTDTFARCNVPACAVPTPPPPPPPPPPNPPGAARPGAAAAAAPADPGWPLWKKLVVGWLALDAIGLGVALVYLATQSSSNGGGSCYCVVITNSTNGSCPAGDYPYTSQADCTSGPMGLSYLESFCQCRVATCSATFAPSQCNPCPCPSHREAPMRGEDLAARELAYERYTPVRGTTPNTPHEVARLPGSRTKVAAAAPRARLAPSSSNTALVIAGVAAASLASTSLVLWQRSREQDTVVVPWATTTGAGIGLTGRF